MIVDSLVRTAHKHMKRNLDVICFKLVVLDLSQDITTAFHILKKELNDGKMNSIQSLLSMCGFYTFNQVLLL